MCLKRLENYMKSVKILQYTIENKLLTYTLSCRPTLPWWEGLRGSMILEAVPAISGGRRSPWNSTVISFEALCPCFFDRPPSPWDRRIQSCWSGSNGGSWRIGRHSTLRSRPGIQHCYFIWPTHWFCQPLVRGQARLTSCSTSGATVMRGKS